ncbi:AMP-binding protein [Haladaptatus halobius]|uniref:AMP-binding protein n=1 Tax=Haladaptatus halobius TaxID=2884875 RepID=UPI001D0B1565|nr:AMP-binding protein [Haladaptatus halobius]
MSWSISLDYESYEEANEVFEWDLPIDYNIARDLVRKHDDPKGTVALFQAYSNGQRKTYTFHDVDVYSNAVANGLKSLGIERGDRVAVIASQTPANLFAHLACWKIGAISVPLSILFGTDALRYRLTDSEASVAIVDSTIATNIDQIKEDCPDLNEVITIDSETGEFPEEFISAESRHYDITETNADTPAILMYTSGSTGPPKGVLHSHSVWIGHCPAFQMYFEREIDTSVFWTPADWAWIGSLGDLVFPAWHYGRPVVGYPMGKFDSEIAYEILEEYGVTDAFLPPTAIRMMMDVSNPTERYSLDLKAICSGGEPLTPEILKWAEEELSGVSINELYGQTEANLLVCNCQDWFPAKAGSMGKSVPGHTVQIIDSNTGELKGPNEIGEIAVKRSNDPAIFKEYWGEPEKTEETKVNEWHLTGDLGYRDENDYIWFKSRDDDIIITSGYRVGPGEVETAILEHEDVEQVGVIGVPNDKRGEIIKAFVQPMSGATGDEQLREEIRNLVRERLAKYEYPREISFIDELPQTTTGKIRRKDLRERNNN